MKEVIIIYSERVVQILFGLLLTYVLLNHLSAEDYGVYKYILSLSAFFLIFILLGFNVTNICYIPEYIIKNEKGKANYQILVFFLTQITLMIATFFIVWILLQTKTILLTEKINTLLLLALFTLNFLKSYLGESLHIAFSERVRLTLIRITLYFAQLLILLYAVYIADADIIDLQWYLVFYASIEVLLLLLSVYFIYPHKLGTKKISKADISPTFSYAAYNYGFSWVNFMRDNAATVIVVSYLYSFTEVTYYSIALLIPNMIRAFTPSKVFSGFLMPEYVKRYTSTNNTENVFDGLNLVGKLNIVYLVAAITFSVFSYQYIINSFFDNAYTDKTFHLSLFLFANIILLSFLDLFILSANILRRSHLVFKVNLFSVSNIVFLFTLKDLGLISIGIANLTSTLVTVLVFWYTSRLAWRSSIKLYFFDLRILSYALLLNSALYFFIEPESVTSLVFCFSIAISSMFIFVKTSFFTKEEKNYLCSHIPSKFKFLL